MVLGDGHTMKNGTRRYDTSSTELANDFQRLCFHAGWSCNITIKYKAGHESYCAPRDEIFKSTVDAYRMTIITKQNTPIVNKSMLKDFSLNRINRSCGTPIIVYCLSDFINLLERADKIKPDDEPSAEKGLKLLLSGNKKFVFTITTFPYPIQRALRLVKNNNISMMQPENYNTRSQDLELAYHDAGQFYWGYKKTWLHKKIIFAKRSDVIMIPKWRYYDIDTMDDWKRAELNYKILNKKNSK